MSGPRSTCLVAVLVAKIEDEARLDAILCGVPVVQNDPNWRCRAWVRDAVNAIAADGRAVGTSELVWAEVEDTAKAFVGRKD
ncbi:hypothetical protein BDZ85DRAFT_313592 [Elsinoe ampelina]|uniref:Uncharacterized protein n=1 Tax=Elsinoe ampelina TaxID=302913 RepID=A0A6A6GAI7_9PEZI|nr:hypothetical protein BDZ85DRAFT_313592 [Elsinoe ampelina]